MVSSKHSPIIHAQAARSTRDYMRYDRGSSFGDIMLILTGCFALYGLFLYYFLPRAATASYQRSLMELHYHWQLVWNTLRYTLLQLSHSFSHTTLIGEWYQYLTSLLMF